jgi:hypothetical protein
MTPQEIIDACLAKGVKLRINPTSGRLTAIPRRKLTDELLKLLREQRATLTELIEERDGGGAEMEITDLPPEDPPKPCIAKQIIDECARRGIKLVLDQPNQYGMLKVITPWIKRHNDKGEPIPAIEIPEAQSGLLPAAEYVGMQRAQIPADLLAPLNNFRTELLAYLRAPYIPLPPPEPADDAPKSERSIWERMAHPDNLLPNAKDNQKHVRDLLFGDMENSRNRELQQRQAMLNQALPMIIPGVPPKGK